MCFLNTYCLTFFDHIVMINIGSMKLDESDKKGGFHYGINTNSY